MQTPWRDGVGGPEAGAAEGFVEIDPPEPAKLGTADASTVEPGGGEVELGVEFETSRRTYDTDAHTSRRDLSRAIKLDLNYTAGVWKDLDVSVGVP